MIHFIRESRDSLPKGSLAILAPGQDPLTYDALLDQVELVSTFLGTLGFGRGDKIAIVLPEGPCAATTLLGVANVAVAAPLNPGYRKVEFEHCFSRLGAQALIVSAGSDSVSREVARQLNMAILEVVPDARSAGLFKLRSVQGRGPAAPSNAEPEICIAAFTSGTTSRSKIVPLTRTNLFTSARNITRTLGLGRDDRCLNVMPLFHMHGFVSTIMATIASGGSVVCTAGARFPDFFEWLREFRPTWYTASPTIHQAILSHAPRLDSSCRLRFVRSASASLPHQTMAELSRLFQAPVIENYGMTESCQQIASNPLPPARQKPGSVGLPAGPEVAIFGESGELLSRGETGEVVIRGPTVMSGYENDPEANERAFVIPGPGPGPGAWFRTGDLGYFDSDGYLFLVGRIKEIINRGGEKISPREVDEALLSHPSVWQAATFAMPHPTLGEEVCAAVTLKKDLAATEAELREYLRERLAEFKVPRRVLLVNEIPRASTGKIQRAGLFESFKDRLTASAEGPGGAPRSAMEEQISSIWKSVLKKDQVGIHDNFFSLGGDSLQALTVIARAMAAGILIDPAVSFKEPTIAGLASVAKPISQEASHPMAPPPPSKEPWWEQLRQRL